VRHTACDTGGVPSRAFARVGCSGWQYKHWRGVFYPVDMPARRWFDHYTTVFDTVEVNNSFYRLPEAATFETWKERAPRRFLFAVKASRFLTHMKKLKDPEQPLERLFDRARHLGSHLGPVLYQLPPGWKLDVSRLEHFLHALPRDARHVIELRDPSWYDDRVFAMLEQRGVALCLHDMEGSATARERVGPFVYVRFHGATGTYSGSYSNECLRSWAVWLRDQWRSGADVYAYFNNDAGGHAPQDALTLRRYLEETK
jgi:uncharacterized protein YecE (DUF72 family)